MFRLGLTFIFSTILAVVAHADPTLRGTSSVILGDVLEVQGKRVRLVGIDAPEKQQDCRAASGKVFNCGHISATALMDLTAGVAISCVLTGNIVHGLPTALCRAGGYDLSRGMVHSGWALGVSGIRYDLRSDREYRSRRKHGLWRGSFDAPWDWRNGIRKAVKKPAAAN